FRLFAANTSPATITQRDSGRRCAAGRPDVGDSEWPIVEPFAPSRRKRSGSACFASAIGDLSIATGLDPASAHPSQLSSQEELFMDYERDRDRWRWENDWREREEREEPPVRYPDPLMGARWGTGRRHGF